MEPKSSKSSTAKNVNSHQNSVLFDSKGGPDNLGVSIRDSDFHLTYLNPLLIERYGNRLGERCHGIFNNSKERCPDCPVQLTLDDGKPHSTIREVKTPSGRKVFWENTAIPLENHNGTSLSYLVINKNITAARDNDHRRILRMEFAECIKEAKSLPDLIHKITGSISKYVQCDAIGIRLQDGTDFPYFETRGFPKEFVRVENSLCDYDKDGNVACDKSGNPLIQCMCGNIICNRVDPKQSFFTEYGSFWSNHTSKLLTETSDEDRQTLTRNRCNGEGYESVVLIPLGVGDRNFGLLQLNDKRINYFSDLVVSTMEEIAHHLALAIDRQMIIDELAKSKDRFKMIADFTYDWEMAENSRHELIYVSPACERITGFSPDQFMNDDMFLSNLIVPEDRALWDDHHKMIETKRGLQEVQLRIKNKNGETVWLEHACQPVIDDAGNLKGWRSSIRDISYRIRLQEELTKREKLKMIGVLAGGLAHDFNNILGGVVGYISLAMLDISPNSEAYHTLASAEKATLRAAGLTQKLLTFSKGDAPVIETLNLSEVVRESAEFTLSGSNVIAEYHSAEDLSAVEADRGQMGQVVQNLTINAIQAMPDGGVLDIRIEICSLPPENSMQLEAGNYARLIFKDQGVGIPDEIKGQIFDPFFSTKPKGSGLGLATCYAIVNKHNGYIGVDSTVGQGSTFTIYLPAQGSSLVTRSIVGQAVDQATIGQNEAVSGRILVMDDEPDMRDVAAKSLSRVGYKVECAKNTPEAVKMFKDAIDIGQPFDLVLLDLTIRGENGGKKTVRLMQEIDSGVKAVVFSGYSNDPIMANPEEYGFCGVIQKPFTPTNLVKSVGNILNPEK